MEDSAAAAAAAEDLDYFPSVVEVVDTRLEGGGGHTAYYVLRCCTPAMHSWGVAKRFSQFCALRDTCVDIARSPAQKRFALRLSEPPPLLPCRLSEVIPTVYGLPFPAKTWFGGGNDEETVRIRRQQLHEWMKGVIDQCPGNREVMMFLADDGRYVSF